MIFCMYRIYNHRHELEINTEIIMKNVSSHGNDFAFYVVKFSLLKIVVCGTRENAVFCFCFGKQGNIVNSYLLPNLNKNSF